MKQSDNEIVEKLIAHDEQTTRWFFYVKCRPLFLSIIKRLFNYPVDYVEFVNEIYLLLMEDNAARLRQFDFRSSIYQWLKVVTLHHFIKSGDKMIDETSQDSLLEENKSICNPETKINARMDVELLLCKLKQKNEREAYVIKRLMLDDADYETVADELQVKVSNLYNIKKRAMADMVLLNVK